MVSRPTSLSVSWRCVAFYYRSKSWVAGDGNSIDFDVIYNDVIDIHIVLLAGLPGFARDHCSIIMYISVFYFVEHLF